MTKATRMMRAVALAGCLLLAAGCDGDNAATPPPPATPSSTPTPTAGSPSPTASPVPTSSPQPPPAIPPAATKGLTVTSAEAFTRFYVTALDHAASTGDVTLLRRFASKSCGSCLDLANLYEQQYKAGGSVNGNKELTVTRVTRARLLGADAAEVVLAGRYGRHTSIAKSGATPKVFPGGPATLQVGLESSGGHWTVAAMVQT